MLHPEGQERPMTTTSRSTSRRGRRWRSLWLAVSAVVTLGFGVDLLPARATPEAGVLGALPPGYQVVENSTQGTVPLANNGHFALTAVCLVVLSIIAGGASLSVEPSGNGALSLVSNGPLNATYTSV